MRWESDYEIGIVAIDQQHKKLVEMIKILENATQGVDQMTQETGIILKELVEYVKNHFSDEEQVMKKISYPEYSNHKKKHKELVDEVRGILISLKNGAYISNTALLQFLKKWLLEHILMEDKKIGDYLFGTK